MGFLPTIRQRFQSDLQYRLGLVAYVPILCLGVLAAGGLVFLPGSTGVRVYGIFGLLGVGLSALIAHRTIKAVLESLDRIAGSARALVSAQESLLDNDRDPIEGWLELDESSHDELGFLAGAVNSMHRNTVEIDRNQNDSVKNGISNIVVNLARRSQALLDRQVEYIDELENTEEDPDRLEQMFKVDHLATRMRRNAESLLVLADADPGRRRGGPVDVADVLRVAMGEIENYQHIELTSVEPGQVTAAAAVDLAHMAAELMENATQFSPPDAPVEVTGRLVDGQYLVSIVDHGMGMPDDQLEKANSTLTNPPELGLAMGRSLGFVVIGRLAQRVGAQVDIQKTANSGITARIAVPTSVFTEVGDNSGIRRSVVAPEAPQTATSPAEDEQRDQRSPALSKLLGLDVATLAGGSSVQPTPTDAAPSVEPTPPDTDSDALPEVASAPPTEPASQDSWSPPPVTPDAPISLPPEVAALADVVPEDQGWTPPAVSADAGTVPLSGRQPIEPVPGPAAIDEHLNEPLDEQLVEQPTPQVDAPIDEPASFELPSPPIGDGVAETPGAGYGDWSPDREPWAVAEASDSSTPEAEASPSETVSTVQPPTNLEDALPTGQAFESGMASLLDENLTDETPTVHPEAGDAPASAPQATSTGLTRRKRGQSKVPAGEGRSVAASSRKPDEIRSMLSRYRDGIKGNKSAAETGEEA